ncbi:DUF1326 domain-containing protein [Allosalinactinospora lopnorensis]|uniref:DUF1326 domain-containing protein n=1 Tax=Allosalinactinospora lopnorensis TaxID=1352348 RepID=UPI000623E813|nr:DUF1326 domain-containing protein [Allosalinactinospora lopnorensis]
MNQVPQWRLQGDWFDVCKCDIPCPCYFAQAPTYGSCDGTLVWHIREGRYGDVVLDGLNVLALGAFTGNIWAGGTKAAMGVFFDERADERQRAALQAIFTGQAGGWPKGFAELIGEMRGMEFAPIEFDVDDDLESWSARIPGRVEARAEALAGPTSLPGRRVQVHNPAGSEVGPGTVATQGVSVADRAEGFAFQWDRSGQSSKHMRFDWSGPDEP